MHPNIDCMYMYLFVYIYRCIFFRCWCAQLALDDAVTVTATCHYAVVDDGVRQLFEGLRRAYSMPLTPSQQAGLNRYCRYSAEDAWARYAPVYDTAEGQNLGLWAVPAFRAYIEPWYQTICSGETGYGS